MLAMKMGSKARKCGVLAVALFSWTSLQAAEIWIGTDEPEWRKVNHWPANDYLEMFSVDAPWRVVASRVDVFHLTKRFILEAPDVELRLVIGDLKRRGIKIAVQGTPLVASKKCGLGIEGYGPPDDILNMSKRLKSLGGEIDYVSMDEPLWFGHRSNGPPGSTPCHSTIPEIAQQTAVKMRSLRTIFPDAKIGDIEPMGIPAEFAEAWKNDLKEWMDAYRQEMGEPLAFLQLDVIWMNPTWREVLSSAIKSAKEREVPIGIIYNGTPKDATDEAWVEGATSNFKYVEGDMGLKPAQAFFFSWMDHPRQMLSETKPGSLTNLILRYLQWKSNRK
jgi:hypothetical protein